MSKIAVLVSGMLERPSDADFEQDVERTLDVLEEHGAIGPAVGADTERSVIDIRFSIEGDDSAAVHHAIGDITEAIDTALGGRVTTALTPGDQLEVACA